jgi:hypothetical protein
VQVNVIYGLTAITAAIHNEPVARVRNPEVCRDPFCGKKQVAHRLCVFRFQLIDAADVSAWHNQDMHRRLRVDIPEGSYRIILEDKIRRDLPVRDSAEDAVVLHDVSMAYWTAPRRLRSFRA